MNAFVSMLIASLYAMLFQNLVFTSGYAVSESVKVAKRPKHFVMCAVSVAFFATVLAFLGSLVMKIGFVSSLKAPFHYLIYVLILSFVYLLSGFFCVHALGADKKFMNSLGMCAFNSLVVCVPVLNFKSGYGILQSLATGIGAALAFVLAVILINAGIRFIAANKKIPVVFRGTPALFIYISLLSLGLSCFSGQSLFI